MEKYIVDERTGWKYELVGDYYLPVGTRFEDATTDDAGPCPAETNTPLGDANTFASIPPKALSFRELRRRRSKRWTPRM